MHYLSGYRLLEVGNPYGTAFEHWDAALSTGHRVYGIGDDDTHNIQNTNEVGRFFTMINTHDMVADSVYAALDRGCAYTVEFHPCHNQPFATKVNKMHNELYHLTRCELIGDTLLVKTDAPIIEIAEFIGQEGKVMQHQEYLNQAFYVIQPSDTYIRVKLRLPDMTFIYLNPITRHTKPTPIDPSTAEINWPLTLMCYAVYIVVIILLVFRLFKKK
jgi:hypothetical protein